MIRRSIVLLLLVLFLAACGGSSGTSGGASGDAPAATVAPAAQASPEATVEQAITAMSARDEAGLTELFDVSLGNLRSVRAFESVREWNAIQSEPDPISPGALGPIQSREMLAPETRGQTTVVRMRATHEKETSGKQETSLWEFSLTQTAQGWRLLNIHGQWEQ